MVNVEVVSERQIPRTIDFICPITVVKRAIKYAKHYEHEQQMGMKARRLCPMRPIIGFYKSAPLLVITLNLPHTIQRYSRLRGFVYLNAHRGQAGFFKAGSDVKGGIGYERRDRMWLRSGVTRSFSSIYLAFGHSGGRPRPILCPADKRSTMPFFRFLRSPVILNPSFLAGVAWVMVTLLYSLHLSSLLLFTTEQVMSVTALIVIPILVISLLFQLAYSVGAGPMARTVVVKGIPIAEVEERIRQCLYLWIFMEIIETITSGGVPLVWLWTDNGKVNFDYGIPSVHGLVDALLLALAAAGMALWLYTGKRHHLWLPILGVFWSFILVSRGTLFVLVAECIVVFLRFRRIRWTSAIQLSALGFVLLLIFGYVGDFRSGAETFRDLARPVPEFPEWAPSGFLWAYIYITTPINNLLYSMHTIVPEYNILLPNTAATLFPTVLRNLIYGKQGASNAISGSIIVEAFNVSTAYVSPFQDMGRAGIVGFSTISAALCEIYWRRSGLRNILFFSVFAQALMLSLFFNMLFSLPILGQLVWFYYFTRQGGASQRSEEVEVQHE